MEVIVRQIPIHRIHPGGTQWLILRVLLSQIEEGYGFQTVGRSSKVVLWNGLLLPASCLSLPGLHLK